MKSIESRLQKLELESPPERDFEKMSIEELEAFLDQEVKRLVELCGSAEALAEQFAREGYEDAARFVLRRYSGDEAPPHEDEPRYLRTYRESKARRLAAAGDIKGSD